MLVAFSCKGRGLCPSCGAKRAAETAKRLREDVLEAVGHAQWVFTIPKMLRPYFMRHRDLSGPLCRAAWQTVREMMAAAAGEQIRPGMVAVIQTFGSTINFHPHVHAIASRGGWTAEGQWIAVPHVDPKAAELVFRHKVLSMLRNAGLIDEERIALLLSWKHTGFSVHNSVTVEPQDAGATERLVRYLMPAPVSQQRLEIDADLAEVRLYPRPGADDAASEEEVVETLDPAEAVARIVAQIPEPRKHLIRSYGHYANAARAKREREAAANPEATAPAATSSAATELDSPEQKAARKRWANLIRHIYEADPLVCPRCGRIMKVIAFIIDPRVIRAILDSVPGRISSTAGSRHPPPPARRAVDDMR
jgi:hypothetical protein